VVEAHLRDCPACRRRVLTSDDVGQLLRAAYTSQHAQPNPQMADRIMARIEASRGAPTERRPARPKLLDHAPLSLTWRSASIVVVALALVGAFALPASTWANFPLSRMVGFDGVRPTGTPQARVIPDVLGMAPPADPLAAMSADTPLAFTPLVPETLPGGFTLTGQRATSPTRLVLTYERADGLAIDLVEMPGDVAQTTIERERYEFAQVSGTDVLLHPNSVFQSVNDAIWTDDGLLHSLTVRRETARIHLDREAALAIIEAVNSIDDD
jgi:hypothetical protein